ncbi:MAG: D-alanyl-D-alanine carboxypeptidase [Clostridia bacterium]|nr:D-alanyl-D-alanine carboxypeptidase [Clostridia bacterium]
MGKVRKLSQNYNSILFLICLLLFSFFPNGTVWAESETNPTEAVQVPETFVMGPTNAPPPDVDCKAYALYDVLSDTFLLGENLDQPLAPASITKVMTVLLALENLKPTDTITITRDMFETIPNDYTRLGLMEGEVITVDEALHACLLISANDAAMAIGITLGGSSDTFAAMMNKRARELGCTHTHFTNPYGYADEAHVTTAHDMALIMKEALQHKEFCEISCEKNYMMGPTNLCAESRGMPNGNRFISKSEYAYDPYIGGKTGYTDLSLYTIAAGARKNDRTLVAVILGASNSPVRYENLIDLFEYGFNQYAVEQNDPEKCAMAQAQAQKQVENQMKEMGLSLFIDETNMQIDDYIILPADQAGKSYEIQIDPEQLVIQSGLKRQTLESPVYRRCTDGGKRQIGVFRIILIDRPVSEGQTESVIQTKNESETIDNSKTEQSSFHYLFIVAIVLVLLAGLFCLIAMIRHDLKKRRRNGQPHVL